jgi:hypothetical protein
MFFHPLFVLLHLYRPPPDTTSPDLNHSFQATLVKLGKTGHFFKRYFNEEKKEKKEKEKNYENFRPENPFAKIKNFSSRESLLFFFKKSALAFFALSKKGTRGLRSEFIFFTAFKKVQF